MRTIRHVIYIDRDPEDIYKGWGWVEVATEDARKYNISIKNPTTYDEVCRSGKYKRWEFPGRGNLPSRGKSGTKRFQVDIDGELVEIRSQKSLTIKAVCSWVKTWAPPNSKVITPGKKVVSINAEKITNQAYFVYFIFNEDSNAIKIGLAKDVLKRFKSLQTSSPAKLKLIKTIQVSGRDEAQSLERTLHQRFSPIRITGEWFRAESEIYKYIK